MHESKRLTADVQRAGHKSEKVVVVPDAGFLLSVRQKGSGLLYFVEHDQGTEKGPQVLRKFRKYEGWWQSAAGQAYLLGEYERFGI